MAELRFESPLLITKLAVSLSRTYSRIKMPNHNGLLLERENNTTVKL